MTSSRPCPAGHDMPAGPGRICRACRRDQVIAQVTAETSLPAWEVSAAVDAVATSPAMLRSLAQALSAGAQALAAGAPPAIGRLVTELIARGSATLPVPACITCGATGQPLNRTGSGGMCSRCARHAHAAGCVRCGKVKPVAGRVSGGQPLCERCRRWERGLRPCSACGSTAPIAVRARGGHGDICVNCYRMPTAVCSVCGKRRECNHASTETPVCATCTPRATAPCARCGASRPPAVRWEEGPLCDPCYTAALRHRGICQACGAQRRLVFPPGPGATDCAGCAGVPVSHACTDCGLEDKLYEKGRCARCSLHRRATELLCAGTGQVPAGQTGMLDAITRVKTPRSALNWLRKGAGAALLADITAGRLAATHQALDAHPNPRAADYLRHILTVHGVLPPRDEGLARTERWLQAQLASTVIPEHRQLLQSFAAWQVMRRLRRSSETASRPRTPTAHARLQIKTSAAFLAWLNTRNQALADCRQADVDQWLTTSPSACCARQFLLWAAEHHHCPALQIPGPPRIAGIATDPEQRWALVSRLLHDGKLEVTDRIAGSLLLLFGQQQSRIAAMTTSQVTRRGDDVFVSFGQHDIPVPASLGDLLLQLLRDGKPYTGVGSPARSQWLFPGGMPGRPITPSTLAGRLRKLGIATQSGRRAALMDLAAQLPAAVLADLLNLHPTTAARWIHEAGGDWSRYAAQIARSRNHQQ
jgi:hypothetical protein